jgi:hypothetical protein
MTWKPMKSGITATEAVKGLKNYAREEFMACQTIYWIRPGQKFFAAWEYSLR